MLSPFREILSERLARGAAAGAFTCYDVTTSCAVVRAAEALGVPVIVLVSEASFRAETGRALVAGLRAVADEATVRVAVQLDHVDDLDLVQAAASSGIGAVMADGSRWPIEQNIASPARPGPPSALTWVSRSSSGMSREEKTSHVRSQPGR